MWQLTPSVGFPRLGRHHLVGSRTMKVGAGLAPRRAQLLVVESLETRALLATFTVLNTGDTGTGTLRAAIEQANLSPAQNSITFAPSVSGTITLTSALPELTSNISISGPGPSTLTIARSTAPGTPAFRIFYVAAGQDVTISGLTMTGGSSSAIVLPESGSLIRSGVNTDGVGPISESAGGGIYNAGTLAITDCSIVGNSASDDVGVPGMGGGIYNLVLCR